MKAEGIRLTGALVAFLVCSMTTAAFSDEHYPYTAKICCGDRVIAQMLFGDDAAATFAGRDAIPVFMDIAAYDEFYRTDDDSHAEDATIREVYHTLHAAGRASTLVVGEAVKVLGEQADPEDKNDTICRISFEGRKRYVLCTAIR